MSKSIPDGVWPTMVTPFTDENKIDYEGLERMIEWYLEKGVAGLFAVCQSSEMFYLSLEERVELASFVKEKVKDRVAVIASGHISDNFQDQVKELNLIAETGVDAVVLITNRLAGMEESDDIWRKNMEELLKHIPEDVCLGLYECPYPYKRIILPEQLKFCAETGRFFFLKDTSCDVDNIRNKLEAVRGSNLKIFNANAATLLETLKLGVAGYSGVMANFHPELYVWLFEHWRERYEQAEKLSNFLGVASLIERQVYPVNAKYYLNLEGLGININSRSRDYREFSKANRMEVEQLRKLSIEYREKLFY